MFITGLAAAKWMMDRRAPFKIRDVGRSQNLGGGEREYVSGA